VSAGQATTVNLALPRVATPPAATPQNTPVVLVRGFGRNREWAEDYSKSWSWIRSALEANGFANIWDCNEPEAGIMNGLGHVINGQQGIAWNAKTLKVYLGQKSRKYNDAHGHYPPKIHIVAHSMGGLIVRRALGDYAQFTFSGTTPPLEIGKVIMLATPHCGSPLANLKQAFIRLSRQDWANCGAMDDLTTASMRNFNLNSRWPGLPLYLAWASNAGYGYDKSWNGEIDTCPLGKLLIGPWNASRGINNTQEDWHDGAVTKPSATGVYWTRDHWWTRPYPVTSIALNPVQTVCDADLGTAVDHLYILKQSGITDWVVSTLLNPEPAATAHTAGSPAMKAIGRSLGVGGETQQVVQLFESLDGMLPRGTVVTSPVTSDAETTLSFELVATDTNTVFRLQDPAGTVIGVNTPLTNSNVQYSASTVMSNLLQSSFTVAAPTAGVWTAFIDASHTATTQVTYRLTVFGDSNVGLIPQTAGLLPQGQHAVLACGLVDGSTNAVVPVVNASVAATVGLPDGSTNSFILFDDGWHDDGAPDDGLYAGEMTNVQQVGTYSVTYRANGVNAQGQPFQRVTTADFSVSSGNGSILGDPVYDTVDTDGDGYADFLTVNVWVNPAATGSYILCGQLVDATGQHNFARTAQFSADTTGPVQVPLIFDLVQVVADGGQGEYHIENLLLFEATPGGTDWLDTYRGSSSTNMPAANPFRVWLAGHDLPSDGSADDSDSDDDGMNNRQEYVAGTDPTNPNSLLSVTSGFALPGEGFVLRWRSVSNRLYDLSRGANLLEGTNTFILLPDGINVPGNPPENSYTDRVDGVGPYFYRIGVHQ